ncbi:hypothetical protein E2C01_007412 [Portunus trituberculatus]|uniref:Uncharacterized protein n=1 Tax=Portunus trituberculatus TaxID=210409 RepID=A0A5B7D0F4_PORTR|nr:hypothetical protein [Portunus trituberculatus]
MQGSGFQWGRERTRPGEKGMALSPQTSVGCRRVTVSEGDAGALRRTASFERRSNRAAFVSLLLDMTETKTQANVNFPAPLQSGGARDSLGRRGTDEEAAFCRFHLGDIDSAAEAIMSFWKRKCAPELHRQTILITRAERDARTGSHSMEENEEGVSWGVTRLFFPQHNHSCCFDDYFRGLGREHSLREQLPPPSSPPSLPFPSSLSPTIKARGIRHPLVARASGCGRGSSLQSITTSATVSSHLTDRARRLHGVMAEKPEEDLFEDESNSKTLEELSAAIDLYRLGSILRTVAAAEAYNAAVRCMQDPSVSAERFNTSLRVADKGLRVLISHLFDPQDLYLRTSFGLLAAEIMAHRMKGVSRVSKDKWEPAVVMVLHCVSHWRIDLTPDCFEPQSPELKQWIIRMLQSRHFCPKPFLRVQVLSLVSLWTLKEMQDPVDMEAVLAGIISICFRDRLWALLPCNNLPNKLMSHFVRVLLHLQRWGHMDLMSSIAHEQALMSRPGREMKCLVRICEMAGEAAMQARLLSGYSRRGSRDALYVLGNVVAIFSVLIMSPPLIKVFEIHCMGASAAASLVKTTGAVLGCMPHTTPDNHQEYVRLLTATDVMMNSVNTREELRCIKHILHIYHYYTLEDFYDYSKSIGYPFRRKLAKFNEKCNETSPDR